MRLNNVMSGFSNNVVSGFSRTILALAFILASASVLLHAQTYTFEEVASGLKHRDPPTRLRAIEILRNADYAEAVGPVGATLADGDDRVQLAAAEALHALVTSGPATRRRKVGLVVEVRSSGGSDAAAERRISLKPRLVPMEAVVGFAVALRDENPRVRAAAIDLTALLAPQVCRYTVEQQGDEVCSRLANAVIDNINSREASLRRAAMRALGQLRYPQAVQALSDQLSFYQNGPDARAALEGLAGIGNISSVSIFRQHLAGSDATTRRLAVEGLARSGEREVAADLERLGQTERAGDVLLALHFANTRFDGRSDALESLVAGLSHPSLRSIALAYLLDLTSAAGPDLARFLQHQNAETRRLVADVLGFSRNHGVIPALEAAAKDADADAAAAAARAIARLKLEPAAPPSR